MYRIYRLRSVVRIDPSKLDRDLAEVALEELRKRYENVFDKNLGVILMVMNPKVDPEGYIIMGDGAPYHYVEFEVLAYVPVVNEIVEGVVELVGRPGINVKVGPIDGFVHISQISDEEAYYDSVRQAIVLRQSKRTIERGDIVRARITSVSGGTPQRPPRVSMTLKQPYLGKREWILEYIKKQRGG